MYGYLSMGDKASAKADEDTDVEADRTKTSEDTTSSRKSLCCSKKEDKQVVKAKEEHILKMGKCHQFLYLYAALIKYQKIFQFIGSQKPANFR